MRRRASRMTSASPMISMRASRSVGIGSSTPYRNTATAASTAVHAKRNGVGSTTPGSSSPARNSALPIHGSSVARIRIVARLRYRYGDCTACDTRIGDAGDQRCICERDVDPEARAATHQHRRSCPAPSSRRSPQNKWCEPSVHASTSRPAATAPIAPTTRRVTSASRATKSRMNPAHATGIISTPRYFTFSASILSSRADGAQFPGVRRAPDGQGHQQHRVPQRATDAPLAEGVQRQRQQDRGSNDQRKQARGHPGIYLNYRRAACRLVGPWLQRACRGRQPAQPYRARWYRYRLVPGGS